MQIEICTCIQIRKSKWKICAVFGGKAETHFREMTQQLEGFRGKKGKVVAAGEVGVSATFTHFRLHCFPLKCLVFFSFFFFGARVGFCIVPGTTPDLCHRSDSTPDPQPLFTLGSGSCQSELGPHQRAKKTPNLGKRKEINHQHSDFFQKT